MITDAQVNAALAVHYPGEWPDDPIFDKPIDVQPTGRYFGKPWRIQVIDEMRGVLEAAFAAAPIADSFVSVGTAAKNVLADVAGRRLAATVIEDYENDERSGDPDCQMCTAGVGPNKRTCAYHQAKAILSGGKS